MRVAVILPTMKQLKDGEVLVCHEHTTSQSVSVVVGVLDGKGPVDICPRHSCSKMV